MTRLAVVAADDEIDWARLAPDVERLRVLDRAPPMMHFPRLRELCLHGRAIDDASLASIPEGLVSLSLEETSVLDLANVPRTPRLDVSSSRWAVTHGFGPRKHTSAGFLMACAEKEALRLARTRLRDDGLAAITSRSPELRFLDIGGNHFPSEIDLRPLARLETFAFGDGGAASLRLPSSIRRLDLFRTRTGALDLSTLDRLEALSLSYAGPQANETIASLPTGTPLAELQLDQAGIVGATLAELPRVAPNLEALNLEASPIGDADLAPLLDLPKLRELSLRMTQVSDAGAARLRERLPLQKLDVRYTNVVDPEEVDDRVVAYVGCPFTEGWS